MSRFSRARQVRDPVEALIAGRGDCPCMKKVKPPVAPVGCVQNLSAKGVNLVQDPSFEQTYAGGPNGETFPGEIGAGQGPWPLMWADGSTFAPYSPWAVFTNQGGGTANMWQISTANPRTGSQHARFVYDSAEWGDPQSSNLYTLGPEVCTPDPVLSGDEAFMTAIVSPGDIITVSCWGAVTAVEQMILFSGVELWNEDWTTFISDTAGATWTNITSGGTYQQDVAQYTIPANAYWAIVGIFIGTSGSSYYTDGDVFDIDDVSVVIT